MGLQKYISRRCNVTAVRLAFENEGDAILTYNKWGNRQIARAGDWIVCDGVDTWTVENESFEENYRHDYVDGGYYKFGPVWAMQVDYSGLMPTKEGYTVFRPGDYLVFNSQFPVKGQPQDGWAMKPDRFHQKYEFNPIGNFVTSRRSTPQEDAETFGLILN